jgi:hypothetical protein
LLQKDIRNLREMMATVHYYAESHWLAAAVEYPWLCRSEEAREALRSARTIAWQFGFPAVSVWLTDTVLTNRVVESESAGGGLETDWPQETRVGRVFQH